TYAGSGEQGAVHSGAQRQRGLHRRVPLPAPRSRFGQGDSCMSCVTQMHFARQGTMPPQMERVAEREQLPLDLVRDEGARGRLLLGTDVKQLEDVTEDGLLDMVQHQAQQVVHYVTVHCGILREYVGLALGRVTGIVSRGGSLHAYWMMHHNKQNPFYEHFDRILEIA